MRPRWTTSNVELVPEKASRRAVRSASGLEPVGDHALVDRGDHLLDVRLVEAQDRRAVERHLVDELRERRPDRVEVGVVVEVLGVHRGDHGDGRRELEEGAVRLVGLGHEELALAELGIGAEAVDAAADDDGGIEPARPEHRGDERRRRGLAVGARDGDAVLEPHELGEHLRPRDDGDAALARHLHLDVVGGDGGRVDDHVGALDVGGLMAGEDLGPQALEPLHRVVAPGVRAGDAIAQVEQDLGNAAHAHATDAHEVDLPVFLEHDQAWLACWEMFSRTPAENMVIRSAEPPKEMNGSGRPFVGRAPVTTPRFTRVCVASMIVSPSAR